MSFQFRPNNSLLTKILNVHKIKVYARRTTSALHRQNFSNECENAINKQINLELTGGYAYMAMAYHCDSVALKGAFKYFKKASEDEIHHAHQLMEYMNKRGGQLMLTDISAPTVEYRTLMETLIEALKTEMSINQALLELHEIASKSNDANLCDFIETNFLQEQVDAQKLLSDYIQQLERAENCVGSFIFDRRLGLEGKMHD